MHFSTVESIAKWVPSGSVAAGLAVIALAVTFGLGLGAVRVRGVRLGIAGVLFAALLFGQIGLTVDSRVLEFLSDFSLVVFMYAIGLQVGPGFLSSLRSEGLKLNLLLPLIAKFDQSVATEPVGGHGLAPVTDR